MKLEDPEEDCIPCENTEDTPFTMPLGFWNKSDNFVPFEDQFLVCYFDAGRDDIVNNDTPSDHESRTVYDELSDPPNHKIR